jgi:hypothetical protein
MIAVDARNFSFYFHPVLLLHSAFCPAFYPIMQPGECNLILYIIFFFPRNECCGSGSAWICVYFLSAGSRSASGLRTRFRIQWSKPRNRTEGFSCSLDVLHGGKGILKNCIFLILKKDFFRLYLTTFDHQNPVTGSALKPMQIHNTARKLLAFLKIELSLPFADLRKNLSCAGQPVQSLTFFYNLCAGINVPDSVQGTS